MPNLLVATYGHGEDHDYWFKGDDYTGDPAMEQQGLNSVFMSDKSTIELIKEINMKLKRK